VGSTVGFNVGLAEGTMLPTLHSIRTLPSSLGAMVLFELKVLFSSTDGTPVEQDAGEVCSTQMSSAPQSTPEPQQTSFCG